MRILLVTDYASPDGGAEIVTGQLREGLRARGHDARWFASSARHNGAASQADTECFGTTGPLRGLVQSANPSAWSALRRTVLEFQPDVVHVGTFLTQLSPLILPVLRDRPNLYYAHWLRAICPTGFKSLPNGSPCREGAGVACHTHGCVPARDWLPLMGQMRLLRRWRHAFMCTVANSSATREALQANGFPVTDVIPCGVAPTPTGTAFSNVPTVLFSGRLTRHKGLHVLLDAWGPVSDALPAARLVVAGDGPERAHLARIAPPGVSFLGHLDSDALHRVAGDAWVQAVPSIGFEPFGLVAVEAMMRGQAVVASRIGGLVEILAQDGSGLLVEPGDSAALARALTGLLRDRAWCERLGAQGRRAAHERYTIDLHVDRFVALYGELRRRTPEPR